VGSTLEIQTELNVVFEILLNSGPGEILQVWSAARPYHYVQACERDKNNNDDALQ
jgi:hypothetical protein